MCNIYNNPCLCLCDRHLVRPSAPTPVWVLLSILKSPPGSLFALIVFKNFQIDSKREVSTKVPEKGTGLSLWGTLECATRQLVPPEPRSWAHTPVLTTTGSQQALGVQTGTMAKCSQEPGAVLQSCPRCP